jgi:hypothetical protein
LHREFARSARLCYTRGGFNLPVYHFFNQSICERLNFYVFSGRMIVKDVAKSQFRREKEDFDDEQNDS